MPDRPDPVAGALRRGFDNMVRRDLRGVWLAGAVPPGPFVWAANHHSWWDPFLAAVVLSRLGHTPCLLMRQDNLQRYGFARRLGGFGTNEQRRGLDHLRAGRVLVIYPEGGLRPAGPPGDLADGAAWYARHTGVALCAVATRVVLRGHQAAEAYLWCAEVPSDRSTAEVTCRLSRQLADELAQLDAAILATDPREPLPGFRRVVSGRCSWDERIDTLTRWSPWPR